MASRWTDPFVRRWSWGWAARGATVLRSTTRHRRRGRPRPPVVLVQVVDELVTVPHHTTGPAGPREIDALHAMVEELRRAVPGVDVRDRVGFGDTVDSLVSCSEHQLTLVVGKRGLGTFSRLLAGSTSLAVAARAHVPVVVVPDGWRPSSRQRGVVLGLALDGSADAALRYAFVQAADRALRRVEAVLGPLRREFPSVDCSADQPHGTTSAVLLDRARDAELLVLGRQGVARPGLGLGSTVRGVLHYSGMPVAIVPAPG